MTTKQSGFRHVFLRNEPFITRYGQAELDGTGNITNRADLKATDDELRTVPDLVPTALFEPAPSTATSPQTGGAGAPPGEKTPTLPTGDELQPYYDLIKSMVENPTAKRTNSGLLDLPSFLELAKGMELKAIPGSQMREIEKKVLADLAAKK